MALHERRWRDLLPGIIALGLCLAAAFFVLRYARVGALRGDTFPLVVVGGSAQDLLQGTEVWLAGQPIGQVESIEFRPPSTDTASRLAIRVLVYERARPLLRSDSDARITTGGSLLGASVLALTPGSPDGAVLADGDTLHLRAGPGVGAIAAELQTQARLDELITNMSALGALVTGTSGSVGALLRDGDGGRELARLGAAAGSLTDRLSRGSGTMGRFAAEGVPQRRIGQALARADSLQRLLDSGRGSYGRFRRDSTLLAAIEDVRNELDILRRRLDSPDGTVGRLQADGIIALQLDSVSAAMGALARDVRRRPFRYLSF